MEINLEVRDEGPIRTRRTGSGVACFLGRIREKVADLILEACYFFIGCLILGAWEFTELIGRVRELIGRVRQLIGRAWRKVRPIIFMAGEKWERAFVVSCIAVSLDPLFLYIPIVDETNKCLAMDKNLKPIALILRSLTDFLLITHIIAQICNRVQTDYPKYPSSKDTEHGHDWDSDHEFYVDPEALNPEVKFVKHTLPWTLPWSTLPWSIIIKVLAVLPVPQVGILVGFFRMRGSDFLVIRKFINVSLVLHYLPRVGQIYVIKSKFRMAGKWVNPLFNLLLYLLASHVLGGLWYFFAIERETSCWYKACRKTHGCVDGSYNCGGSSSTKNITLLDQLCPINSPNSTIFDFGIFVKILQSGNTGLDKVVTKLFYSFWWGLKNLSNFGTNLETSSYLWENCFAILICVIGLLLFLYLIGNVQLYIQSATQKSLDKEKLRTQSIKKKKADITNWMKDKFLSEKRRRRIKRYIREDKVVEQNLSHDVDVDVDVDVEYFIKPSVTPRIRKRILKHLGMAALKEGPEGSRAHPESSKITNKVLLGDIMDDAQLKRLCQKMEPLVYKPNSNVVRQGDQLDKMLFIIEGELKCTNDSEKMIVKKKEYYGQYILEWALNNYKTKSYYDDRIPPSPRLVDSGQAKVEALGLDARKLLRFIESNVKIDSPKLEELALSLRETDQIHTKDPLPRDSTVKWNPPDRGSVKLNCASLWNPESKKACVGGIWRDDTGALIEAGRICCSQTCIDEFGAAAYSIKSYIKLHPKYVSRKIVVESDNKLLVDCLNDWAKPSSKEERVRFLRCTLQSTLDAIFREASKYKSYTFVHCERQTNAAAIRIAEHADAEPHDSSKTWTAHENIPPWLATVLKEDSPPPKVPNQEPDPKEQTQQPVAKVQKQEPVPKEQNQVSISNVQNQELVEKDSEAAPDELKTAKQPLALLLKNT